MTEQKAASLASDTAATSKIAEVVLDAAAEICGTGKIEHLFTTCLRNGARNAVMPDDETPCTACQINAVAAAIISSRRALAHDLA